MWSSTWATWLHGPSRSAGWAGTAGTPTPPTQHRSKFPWVQTTPANSCGRSAMPLKRVGLACSRWTLSTLNSSTSNSKWWRHLGQAKRKWITFSCLKHTRAKRKYQGLKFCPLKLMLHCLTIKCLNIRVRTLSILYVHIMCTLWNESTKFPTFKCWTLNIHSNLPVRLLKRENRTTHSVCWELKSNPWRKTYKFCAKTIWRAKTCNKFERSYKRQRGRSLNLGWKWNALNWIFRNEKKRKKKKDLTQINVRIVVVLGLLKKPIKNYMKHYPFWSTKSITLKKNAITWGTTGCCLICRL